MANKLYEGSSDCHNSDFLNLFISDIQGHLYKINNTIFDSEYPVTRRKYTMLYARPFKFLAAHLGISIQPTYHILYKLQSLSRACSKNSSWL